MTIKIIGAGMAGLLAARMIQSTGEKVVVYEKQAELPNNHSAVLRFRSPLVSEVTGIPFRKVTVVKGVHRWKNVVADTLSYSRKNMGVLASNRSILRGEEVGARWIAPPDFISRLAKGLDIRFGEEVCPVQEEGPCKVISTVPMPVMMKLLSYDRLPSFHYVKGLNLSASIIDCDAYVSLAVPDPSYSFSRVSVTGNELIVECPAVSSSRATQAWCHRRIIEACDLIGVPANLVSDVQAKVQTYAKIAPIEEEERRRFIFWASTVKRLCFSLGRFATWRPGLLMDDVVNDVRVILKLMNSSTMEYDAERMEVKR